jgi:hypothetical protein
MKQLTFIALMCGVLTAPEAHGAREAHIIAAYAVSEAHSAPEAHPGDYEDGQKEKTFTVTKGGTLSVNVGIGDLKIHTWDKNEVYVRVRGDEDDDKLSKIHIRQRENTVYVEYEQEWGNSGDLVFEISIPVQFNVSLETSGGDIRIDGSVTGTVKGETSGGNIRTAAVKGNVNLETSGGDITTEDIDGDLTLNTSGGDIRVGKVTGMTDVHTSGGEISVESSGKSVVAETAGGNVSFGDINGDANVSTAGGDITVEKISGGAKLKTAGGNISVAGANGKVYAKTAGGDVSLEHIVGSVDVKTSAGNLYVELTPAGTSQSTLSTSVGDATLYIPSDAKAVINARVRVQGWWRGSDEEDYIYSDYKEDTFEKSGREKEIRAMYTLNGGGQQISIQTTMGSIHIVKPNGSKSPEKKSKGKK